MAQSQGHLRQSQQQGGVILPILSTQISENPRLSIYLWGDKNENGTEKSSLPYAYKSAYFVDSYGTFSFSLEIQDSLN